MSEARLAATVARFTERNRAGDLARAASLAVRVESQLLRRLRLALLPGLDAAAEADLWFSPLVGARDSTSFTWAPGVAAILRAELKQRFAAPDPARRPVDPAIVRQHVVAAHATASPLVQLEEELAWLAFTGAPAAAIERALGRVVRAFEQEPGAADDLAAWALRALPALPPAARVTAAAWQLGLAASTRYGVAATLGTPPPADWLAHVARNVLVERGRTRLRVERQGGALWIVPAPEASEREPDTLDVPTTRPLWLEVSSRDGRRTAIEVGPERTRLDARGGDVLRNALGEAWSLEELDGARAGSDADRTSVLKVGWLIVRLPVDVEGWAAVRDAILTDVARSARRLEQIDAVVVLSDSHDEGPRHDVIGDELAAATGQRIWPPRLFVSPWPEQSPSTEADVEARTAPHMTAIGDARQVRVIVRNSHSAAGWASFRDAALRTLAPPFEQAMEASVSPPSALVIAIGRDAGKLAERRYPRGAPSIVILDEDAPATLAAPALRASVPGALWSGVGADATIAYTLGCVRSSAAEPMSWTETCRVVEVHRSLRNRAWREVVTQTDWQPLLHAGDPSVGWASRHVAVLIGDDVDLGFERLVAGVRSLLVEDGDLPDSGLLVMESASSAEVLDPLVDPRADARVVVWIFVSAGPAGERLGDEVIRRTAARLPRDGMMMVFSDVEDARERWWAAIAGRGYVASAQPARAPRARVTEAALEALSGSARVLDDIPLRAVHRHLIARCGVGFSALDPYQAAVVAPAPKHVRVDLTALRRVDGGRERGAPSLAGGDRGRVVFVVGASAPSRSAWIDRFLRATARTSEDDTTAGGPVLGWSPAREPFDAALARARALLVPWSAPSPSVIDADDAAGELAWRIEGANALYVLDGLDHDPPPAEARFVVAATRNRAGRVVVSAPSRPTWLSPSDYHVVDLDDIPLPDELSALGRRAFQPTVAAWIDELATWGHDQPVLVAGALVSALSTSGPWRDTPESTRALRLVARAAQALADGDPEAMLADVRDVAAIAIAALGLDACASLLGAAPAQQAQGTFDAGPPPNVA